MNFGELGVETFDFGNEMRRRVRLGGASGVKVGWVAVDKLSVAVGVVFVAVVLRQAYGLQQPNGFLPVGPEDARNGRGRWSPLRGVRTGPGIVTLVICVAVTAQKSFHYILHLVDLDAQLIHDISGVGGGLELLDDGGESVDEIVPGGVVLVFIVASADGAWCWGVG